MERKRLYGLAPEARSSTDLKSKMYSAEATAATYDCLAGTATQVIDAGFPVVVDATFLKRTERDRFSGLAGALGVPFLIIKCEAGPGELRGRIGKRPQDASEADESVLQSQLQTMEPIDSNERQYVIDAGAGDLAEMVQRRLNKT